MKLPLVRSKSDALHGTASARYLMIAIGTFDILLDMGNTAGVPRDFRALERRRMEAARLLKQGMSNSEVARRLGVHRQSAIRWARQLARSGVAGLKAGRAGRRPRLNVVELRAIERLLKRGPQTLGYTTGLWTARRVRELIEYQTGVRYHEAHVSRMLRRLGWICQRPDGKAREA